MVRCENPLRGSQSPTNERMIEDTVPIRPMVTNNSCQIWACLLLALNGHPKSARSGTSESQPSLLIAVELGLDAARGLVLAKTMRNREVAPTNLLTDVRYRG